METVPEILRCEEKLQDQKTFCLEKQNQECMREIHVTEEAVGPFFEVELKPKGRNYREANLHTQKENFSGHYHQEK